MPIGNRRLWVDTGLSPTSSRRTPPHLAGLYLAAAAPRARSIVAASEFELDHESGIERRVLEAAYRTRIAAGIGEHP